MTDSTVGHEQNRQRARWRVGLAIALLTLPGAILADRSLQTVLVPEGMPWLADLMQWGTWLGYGPIDIGIALVLGLIGWWQERPGFPRRAVAGGLAVGLAGILGQVVKNLACRSRPRATHSGKFLASFPCFRARHAAASFPSGHATTAFALAAVLSLWCPRWTGGFLAAAALVGWSRIVLGTHFPSDVLGGAILGCAVVLGLSRLWPLEGEQCKMENRQPGSEEK